MEQWEYKVEKWQSSLYGTGDVEQKLNEFGKKGWELVNIIPQIASSTNSEDQVDDIYVEFNSFIFKRKK
jgi:hypothetical protein